MSTLLCPSCHAANKEHAKFCAKCATPLTAPTAALKPEVVEHTGKCIACHAQIKSGAKFCPSCGSSQQPVPKVEQAPSAKPAVSESVENTSVRQEPNRSEPLPVEPVIMEAAPPVTAPPVEVKPVLPPQSEESAPASRITQKPQLVPQPPAMTESVPSPSPVRDAQDGQQGRSRKWIPWVAAVVMVAISGSAFMYMKLSGQQSAAVSPSPAAPAQASVATSAGSVLPVAAPAAAPSTSAAASSVAEAQSTVADTTTTTTQQSQQRAAAPVVRDPAQPAASQAPKEKAATTADKRQKERKEAMASKPAVTPVVTTTGARESSSASAAPNEAPKPAGVAGDVQACKNESNIFKREACMFRVCTNRWGRDGCPSYDNN